MAAAAALACRPAPGLGSVTYLRRDVRHVVDLDTCRDRVVGRARVTGRRGSFVSPDGTFRATVRGTTIVATNLRTHRSFLVYRASRPVILAGWSPDSRWILFAVDPFGSNSIAADGLRLRAVPIDAGGVVTIAPMLLYDDYRAWCGGSLVLTAGFDRIATTNKRLLVTTPGPWRVRALVRAPGRAWGSMSCAPDGRSVVIQSQPDRDDGNFFHTHWSLWRVGLDGTRVRLTSPPLGYADESPRFSRDGRTILFVRSRRGRGKLYALRDGRIVGPLLSLGYSLGYYGHQDWWQSMSWSLAAAR